MASLFAKYALPSDNILLTSTLSFSGSIHPTKGVDRAWDGSPAHAMIVQASSGRLIGDQGAAGAVKGVALINTKVSGATITFDMHATNAWGAPSFSTPITPGTVWPDGFEVSPFKDLNTLSPSYRWWSINVTAAPNPHGIGEVLVVRNFRAWPSEFEKTPTELRRAEIFDDTDMLVTLTHDRQATRREFSLTMIMTKTELEELWTLWRAAGTGGFLFVRDKNINEAMFIRFAPGTALPDTRERQDTYHVTVRFWELSFGIKIA